MTHIVINALTVDPDKGRTLEERFAARKHAVDKAPGFEGFELLRPADDKSRYFVLTRWATKADFEAWRDTPNNHGTDNAHGSDEQKRPAPAASASELLEFEVVDL